MIRGEKEETSVYLLLLVLSTREGENLLQRLVVLDSVAVSDLRGREEVSKETRVR